MASVPFAMDDPLYSTPISTDLVVSSASQGIVNNDFEMDSAGLVASVVANPSYGSIIAFNSDGTFTYRPTTGYSGPDSFTYKVSNGTEDSNVATVSLQVGQVFGPRTNLNEIPLSSANLTGANVLFQPLTLGQKLIYNSNTEPRPVVAIETSLQASASVPTSIEAQLTFGGVSGSTVTYSTSGLTAGAPLRFAFQVDGSTLSTGYYDYTVTLTAKYSGSADVVQTFTGSQAVVNRNASEFGRGWWLNGLDRLITSSAGALLAKANGDGLWFKKNGSVWEHALGDTSFSMLTQSGSNYVLTSKTGNIANFNSSGYLTSNVDPNSNTWSYAYNGSNQLTTITDPFSRTFTISYSSGYATSVGDFASHSSSLAYSSGKLTSVTLPDPDGGGAQSAPVYTYGYDGTTSLLNSTTDPRSNATTFAYNSTSKRLSQITRPDSTTWSLVPVQTIGLKTGTGNSLTSPSAAQGTITDEVGSVWSFRVNRFGNTTEFTNPASAVTTTMRDQNGLPVKTTEADPDGSGALSSPITRMGYNASGDLLRLLNPDLTPLSFTYNTLHRPLTTTNEVGRVTTMTYDAYGNMLTRADNAGNTWTYTYTSRGLVNIETSPDPDGAGSFAAYVTDNDYDSYGRITTKTLPNSSTLTYTYNSSDLVATATNELGYVTSFSYDALDRLTTVTKPDPDGAGALSSPVLSYEYNAVGLLSKETDPLGNATNYTYNNRNWRTVTTRPDPDGGGSLASPTQTKSYDGTGRVLTFVDSLKAPSDGDTYTYNSTGYLTGQAGPQISNSASNEYDALGRITQFVKNGVKHSYEYDIRGRLTKDTVTPSGVIDESFTYVTQFSYNQAGQKTSRTDANGHTTSWDYTTAGWLNSEVKPDPDSTDANFGPATTFGYDALGRLTAVTDANGSIANYEFNFRGQQTKITLPDPDGTGGQTSPITILAYNNAGSQTSVTDPLSHVTSYTYDGLGRRLTETLPDPDGAGALIAPVTTVAYNAADWGTSVTDARGGVTANTYDNLGRIATMTAPDPDGGGSLTSAVTTYTYGSRGLASVTDPLSHTTSFGYDSEGNVNSITNAEGKISTKTYNAEGLLVSESTPDPDGSGFLSASTTTYWYDVLGRLGSKTDARAGTTAYTYDGVNNRLSLKDPTGNDTTWSYDALDRRVIETNELADARSFVYDAMSNLTRKTDRNGRVTQYVYDQINRRTAEKWLSGTSQTPSLAIATTQEGGGENEVQKVGFVDPDGGFSGTFTLSFGGYTTSSIAVGASAATVKTALEALTSVGSGNVTVAIATANSGEQSWTVTFKGSLANANQSQMTINSSSVTSNGTLAETESTTTNGRALQDEIQTVTLSNATGGTFRLAYKGQTTVPIAYNASASTVDSALETLSTVGSGAVTIALASSVYTITFGGGSLDNTNVSSLQGDVSTATYGTVDRTISTTYNAASQVTQVSDPSATIDYTLDNLGRITSVVNTIAGLTPTVTFDQIFSTASDRTQLQAKIHTTNDFKTDFTFDTLGRMTDIVQQGNSGNAVASTHVTLAYNKLDQFMAFNRYESTGTSNQVASTDFAYDTLNRLRDLDHKQGSTNLATYYYTYDFASRMTGVNSLQDGQTNYTNDATDQLTGADHTGQTDETYAFDANGNRSGYTIGSNNLITSDGTFTYAYDDEGNRITKTDISSGGYTTYTWDYRNRLTAVKDYNSLNALLKETTYAYDTANRLVKSTYDADGAGGGAATSRFWAFDNGINPLLEFKSGSASDVSHRYLWGIAVDQFFADEQPTSTGSAGNVLWGLGDNLGTLRDIADLSGSTTSVTNHRRFGAYGDLVSESNSAVDLVFAFTGKLYDENTKLQNNLNRWYDAAIGQWMSEDPIGFVAGDENVRRMVGNKTSLFIDPLGLQEDDKLPRKIVAVLTPYGPYPAAPNNNAGPFASNVKKALDVAGIESTVVTIPVIWGQPGNQVEQAIAKIKKANPDADVVWIGIGSDPDANPTIPAPRIETVGTNTRTVMEDNRRGVPGRRIPSNGGPRPIIPLENEPGGDPTKNVKNGSAIADSIGLSTSSDAGGFLCNSMIYRMCSLEEAGDIAQGIFIHIPLSPKGQVLPELIPKIVDGVFGPNGDPDGDGVPNSSDPEPFNPNKKKR